MCRLDNSTVEILISYFKYYMFASYFQVHWNNPLLKSDYTDGSGITLYYTSNLRPYDMGVLAVGQLGLRIPPGKTSWKHTATCPSTCTQSQIKDSLKVVGVGLHMHYMGECLNLTICSIYRITYKTREISATGK